MPFMRLNDHTVHFMCSVGKLYEKMELTDCVIITKDGLVHAHRLILAVHSPYLKKLLNLEGMTSIAFKEVEHHIIKLILDLMYYGEAYVPLADMALFTETANLFEIESLSCASRNFSESEDNGASACGVNHLKEDEKNFHLLESGVMCNPDLLHEQDGRSDSGFEIVHLQSAQTSEKGGGIILKEFSEEVKEDQSKRCIQSSNDTATDAMLSDEENSLEELNPFTFVAVPLMPVKIEANDEGNSTSTNDTQLKNPLEELNCNTSIIKECPSELQIKMENEEVIDNNEDFKDLSGLRNASLTNEMKQSFHDFSVNVLVGVLRDCKPIESVHDISVLNDNCDVEETEELNIKFESICEVSECNLKEEKSFHADLDIGNTEVIDPLPLKQSSEAMNNGEEEFSLKPCQQDWVEGLENACSSNFKLEKAIVVLNRINCGSWKEKGINHSDRRRNSWLVDNIKRNDLDIRLEEENSSQQQCIKVLCLKKNCDDKCNPSEENAVPPSIPQETFVKHKPYTGKKCFSSDVCQASVSRNHFVNPVHSHTGDKPFSCDICKASFSRRDTLKNHLRIHTGDKPFTCDVCKASFSQKGSLKIHLRTHTGDKPFTCDVCKASFSQRITLTNHLRIHTGDKPFTCDVCKASFSQRITLKRHIRSHTGDKPFSCDICKASFSQKGSVKIHLRTHTGDKPFTCDVCKASFSQRGHLQYHFRIHIGGKPFTCDVCKASFSQRYILKRHIRSHTGYTPFICNV